MSASIINQKLSYGHMPSLLHLISANINKKYTVNATTKVRIKWLTHQRSRRINRITQATATEEEQPNALTPLKLQRVDEDNNSNSNNSTNKQASTQVLPSVNQQGHSGNQQGTICCYCCYIFLTGFSLMLAPVNCTLWFVTREVLFKDNLWRVRAEVRIFYSLPLGAEAC